MNSLATNNNILERISNHLILHAPILNNIGLLEGKMGIVLFFAHYSRYVKSYICEDFAEELLSQVVENIHSELPIDMKHGLCGIGWGIEYLVQNGFMNGNTDDILIDLDNKIMERDLRRITDFSFETGLGGISCYINMRLQSKHSNKYIPFDNMYLREWELAKKRYSISGQFYSLYNMIDDFSPQDFDVEYWNLGLKNGCAGYGLKMILK